MPRIMQFLSHISENLKLSCVIKKIPITQIEICLECEDSQYCFPHDGSVFKM